MKLVRLMILPLCFILMTACSDDDNNNASAIIPTTPDNTPPANTTNVVKNGDTDSNTQPEPSGTTVTESAISAVNVIVHDNEKNLDVDEVTTLATRPDLLGHVATLRSITSVRETSTDAIELYVADQLIIIINKIDDKWVVGNNLVGFKSDTISYLSPVDVKQPTDPGQLQFSLTSCTGADTTGVPTGCVAVNTTLDLQQTNTKVQEEPVHPVVGTN